MTYFINVPVTDLRREPIPASLNYCKDPLQETQLLMYEPIIPKEERDGWLFVEAVEQMKCQDGAWIHYPGWVIKDHVTCSSFPDNSAFIYVVNTSAPIYRELQEKHIVPDNLICTVSFGTCLPALALVSGWWIVALPDGSNGFISDSDVSGSHKQELSSSIRENIIAYASLFIGSPYHWGGRSAYMSDKTILTSVDCSGLISLIYKAIGHYIPRDAHDQFMLSEKIDFIDLLPGDLIFSSKCDPGSRIDHVMLYAGEEQLIEATMSSQSVRKISLRDKFGLEPSSMKNGCSSRGERIFFGTV